MEKIKSTKYYLSESLDRLLYFGSAMMAFGIFYFGAIDRIYGMDNKGAFIGNLSRGGEIAFSTFYNHGFNHPIVFSILWYFCVINFVVWPIYYLIRGIIYKINNKKRQDKGGKPSQPHMN